MNRGILGEKIFPDAAARNKFIKLLNEKKAASKINLIAYSVLPNHYHLVLQNSSGQLSAFIKRLAGAYAVYYRARFGGKGYVFQNRYKSTLVQEDNYLRGLIIYVLMNPVKAGLAVDPFEYKWSSAGEYFSGQIHGTGTNRKIVEDIFGDKAALKKALTGYDGKEPDVQLTRVGQVMGNAHFIESAFRKFDRRILRDGIQRRREKDYIFDSVESIFKEFEKENEVKVDSLNSKTRRCGKLRAILLVNLKDNAGLRYKDIQKISIFKDIQLSSMSTLYRRAKVLKK
ncbi:MAG: transposase [Elusimicrobia bacterium]|nr:transposase [Elusimicrobiota bacterium]